MVKKRNIILFEMSWSRSSKKMEILKIVLTFVTVIESVMQCLCVSVCLYSSAGVHVSVCECVCVSRWPACLKIALCYPGEAVATQHRDGFSSDVEEEGESDVTFALSAPPAWLFFSNTEIDDLLTTYCSLEFIFNVFSWTESVVGGCKQSSLPCHLVD